MKKSYHTKNKDLIMDYLDLHKEERISASSIYEAIKEKNASINLATVYRNLDKLHNEGNLKLQKMIAAIISMFIRIVAIIFICNVHIAARLFI